jgi:guanylate kinase
MSVNDGIPETKILGYQCIVPLGGVFYIYFSRQMAQISAHDPIELLRKAVILTGPSGSGKNTLGDYLLHNMSRLSYSVSATTRPPRPGEHHGRDYYFHTVEEFHELIRNDEFVEWEEVYTNNFYGTLKSEVDRIWLAGQAVMFVVDVVGAMDLKNYFGEDGLSIFIQTPEPADIMVRLKARGSESEQDIARRMAKVSIELGYAEKFDKILINGDLSTAQAQISSIVDCFLNK